MPVELLVPAVGESITEVQIGKWLKKEGQPVKKDEPLVEIETDKVTLELPAPADGVITKITHPQGTEAKVGDAIGSFEEGAPAPGSAPTKPPHAAAEASPRAEAAGTPPTASSKVASSGAPASAAAIMPAAQRLLDEHKLNPADVTPTGPNHRLLKEDVLKHLESTPGNGNPAPGTAPAQPASAGATPHADAKRGSASEASGTSSPTPNPQPPTPSSTSAGSDRSEEAVPMTPLRRRIAANLVQAQQTAALLTTFNEIDMTEVMSLRNLYKDQFEKTHGVKLGFMSFFVKASIDALKNSPAINAEVRGETIIYKSYYDVGIAIGGGKGLVVPILRNAERMSFADIEKAIGNFAAKAKNNKLTLEDLSGGTFTITNGGIYGSLLSTPIVNPPQSGVLGMHGIVRRPIAVDPGTPQERIEIRPMMYVALTYDHRIVDGREAVTALKRIKDTLEAPARMLMEV